MRLEAAPVRACQRGSAALVAPRRLGWLYEGRGGRQWPNSRKRTATIRLQKGGSVSGRVRLKVVPVDGAARGVAVTE